MSNAVGLVARNELFVVKDWNREVDVKVGDHVGYVFEDVDESEHFIHYFLVFLEEVAAEVSILEDVKDLGRQERVQPVFKRAYFDLLIYPFAHGDL